MWRLYYADGSTFDSSQGSAFDAPGYGAVCARQLRKDGHSTVVSGRFSSEKSHLVFLLGEWKAVDRDSLCALVCHSHEDFGGAVQGRWMDHAGFDQMISKAKHDPDFEGDPMEGEG